MSEDIRYEKALRALAVDLGRLRSGRATPALLDGIRVDYYGTPTPLRQVGAIRVSGMSLVITPWDTQLAAVIEKAIHQANLGLNPSSDGKVIRVPISALTGETRSQIARQAKVLGERTRVSIRHLRREKHKACKAQALPEDEERREIQGIDAVVKRYLARVEIAVLGKVQEIMGT